MPLPPWSEIWDALRHLVAPTLGAAALVMLLGRYLTGERFSVVVAAIALIAGIFAGNYFREAMRFRVDSSRPLTEEDLRTALGWSLEGKPPVKSHAQNVDDELQVPPARYYWLPWMAGLALLVELALRLISSWPGICWTLRSLTAILAGPLLTPADMRVEFPWAPWALGLSMLVEWAILQSLARTWKDGTVAAALSLCCVSGGIVILYAHSARLADMALYFSVALVPIGLIAWIRPSDLGAALSAVAVFLPGLMLNAKDESYSEVPWRSFQLAALAPIALLPMLMPMMTRQTRWARWAPALILPAIPAVWAVVLAAQVETLPFD